MKEDLRVIKTKKIIYETLLELLKEKTFEEIKVSDICEKAMINRSTFYAHYSDKYELFASFIKDLKDQLAQELGKNKNFSNSKEYYMEMLKLLIEHVEEKKEIYSAIMIHNRNSIIVDMVYDTVNADIKSHIEEAKNESKIPSDIVAKFYLGAVFNVSMEWLKNNSKYSKVELLYYFDQLIPEKF